jgi:acyl-CoA thioester hydrolase
MEVGRVALASKFKLDPVSLSKEGFLGPVISIDIKYLRPARFNDQLTVKTSLLRTETATLQFISEIADLSGNKLATGITTHAMTDLEGVLQFQLPPSILDRIEKMMEWLETA